MKVKATDHRYSGIKLPAAQVLRSALRHVPTIDEPIDAPTDHRTFRDIRYWERGQVGYLSFDFYNGAMSTQQCRRLRSALRLARSRPTQVICLLGGHDFWSNGIHLNVIEAADDPARESWRNINAMDDLVLEILTTRQFVVAGLRGNAGAGGVMLALAADRVFARRGVVLNPHYRSMGNLYGSEYWTYTLPRRVGSDLALELTTACQPIGADAACSIGLIDSAFGTSVEDFDVQLEALVDGLAADPRLPRMLADKRRSRAADERARPLASYRAQELARMADNFFGPDASYHEARYRFVRKLPSADSALREPQPRCRLKHSGSRATEDKTMRIEECDPVPALRPAASGPAQPHGVSVLPVSPRVVHWSRRTSGAPQPGGRGRRPGHVSAPPPGPLDRLPRGHPSRSVLRLATHAALIVRLLV